MATATVAGVIPVNSGSVGDGDYAIVTWPLTTADPTGTNIAYPDYADRTVQFIAAAWGGATAVLEGSLDGGTTWFPLTDPQGNAISKTADAGEAVSEAVPLTRARLSAVGVGATVTVKLFVRKAK